MTSSTSWPLKRTLCKLKGLVQSQLSEHRDRQSKKTQGGDPSTVHTKVISCLGSEAMLLSRGSGSIRIQMAKTHDRPID